MLLPDECRLGYVYYLVALNLGLPLRSFRLEATEGSDARPLPYEGPLEDYVDVVQLGGLHLVPVDMQEGEPSPEPGPHQG
eukprot:8538344-Prorocentrum_lima.AAC.1